MLALCSLRSRRRPISGLGGSYIAAVYKKRRDNIRRSRYSARRRAGAASASGARAGRRRRASGTRSGKRALDQQAKKSDEDLGQDVSLSNAGDQSDIFEENYKELKKWVDVKSSKYAMLEMVHEKLYGRLGTTLKVLNDTIEDESEPPKKKRYDLRIQLLLDETEWAHVASYEKQWMHARFPSCLPLF